MEIKATASFGVLLFYLVVQGACQRFALAAGGAGVDKGLGAGFCLGVEKARKCRRIPTCPLHALLAAVLIENSFHCA